MPGLGGAGEQTPETLMHARQEHYQLICIPSLGINILKMLQSSVASNIQSRLCVRRGLECSWVTEHLWNALGLIPSTENLMFVCVCARYC